MADHTTFGSVTEYVSAMGGNKPIETILIANNGIAAVKCIRSMRKWAYQTFGNERAIQFVAMATPEDLRVNAEYIRMADQVEEVPGGSNANNYANVQLIVEIAERRNVQAVWAGWGHASENPQLPKALSQTKSKIAFIGPPESAMRDLGDKIASTIVAQSANVSCVPWSGSGVVVDYSKTAIPDDVYSKCCVTSVEQAFEVIHRIGFPCMIKASEGGGGKGIRKVTKEEEVETAFRQVQGEVPGSPIFIMKMLSKCRHLEVQLIGDQYGEAIALYGRDCSVQRRHQKIIEEGPAIIALDHVWEEMEKAAIRMAKTVGYQGAGTIEYLYDPDKNEYYFLELNPRLQVEHPVTEQITAVNLPAVQLNIAMGIPLHRISYIRRLYQMPDGDSKIDFAVQPRAKPKGHVIAVRITGENPDEGFKPTSGGIQELTFRSTANVWGYFSVGALGGLHEYADSQFGHIFSHGETREEARRELVIGLKELSIRGEIRTPVAYVCYLLETQVFKQNQAHTGWLDSLIATNAKIETKPDPWLVVICGALYKAYTHNSERYKQYISFVEKGQIPTKDLLRIEDSIELIYTNVKYSFTVYRSGLNTFTLFLKTKRQEGIEAEVRPLGDGGFLILVNAKSYVVYGTDTATGLKLVLDGKTCLFTTEYDPTQMKTSTAGKLVRYLVENNTQVKPGTAYAEMEVMKMYLPLTATESGKITFQKAEGSILEAGATIATLELDDPTQVRKAVVYEGGLPEMKPPVVKGEKAHQVLRQSTSAILRVLAGYYSVDPSKRVDDLVKYMFHPLLPALEFQEALSKISAKLPKAIVDYVSSTVEDYQTKVNSSNSNRDIVFRGADIQAFLDKYLQTEIPNKQKRSEVTMTLEPLYALCRRFENGLLKQSQDLVSSFLDDYIQVESCYQQGNRDDTITRLRQTFKDDSKKIFEIDFSHAGFQHKNRVLLALLQYIANTKEGVAPFLPLLSALSDLSGLEAHPVSLQARKMVTIHQLPSFEESKTLMEKELLAAVNQSNPSDRKRDLDVLVGTTSAIFHILSTFFTHPNFELKAASLEVYIRRAYAAYDIKEVKVFRESDDITVVEWKYCTPSNGDDPSESPRGSPGFASPSPGMIRVESDNNLFAMGREMEAAAVSADGSQDYMGIFYFFDKGEEALFAHFAKVLERCQHPALAGGTSPPSSPMSSPLLKFGTNVMPLERQIFSAEKMRTILKIGFLSNDTSSNGTFDAMVVNKLQDFWKQHVIPLRRARVRRITIAVIKPHSFPLNYTFRERLDYQEHPIYRHIEPPLAFHIELRRLSNYNIQLWPTENKQIHLYFAEERSPASPENKHCCFFARAVIRGGYSKFGTNNSSAPSNTTSLVDQTQYVISQAENVLGEALNAIELALGGNNSGAPRAPPRQAIWHNHIFMKFVPEVLVDSDKVVEIIVGLARKYEKRLGKLRVGEVELVGKIRRDPSPNSRPYTVRFIITNPTSYRFNIEAYLEVRSKETKNKIVLTSLLGAGSLDGKDVTEPYVTPTKLQKLRYMARLQNTIYVYDFLDLFDEAIKRSWQKYWEERKDQNRKREIPNPVLTATELVLNANGDLEEVTRQPGKNDIGMVAWRLTMFTPEYPKGRNIILISNDITFLSGSFGPREDLLFKKASELARHEGLPRIYMAANSGARIGLAEEVREKYRVQWSDPNRPEKGFDYFYLTEEDYQILSKTHSINATKVADNTWKITDIIGSQDGLGVENLRGSGMIAGETSRAYDEIFTLTFVTGRTVGIGAYLVRLGQRTIQEKGHNSPVILTGASALNKVLGKQVYTSNVQLGGTQIMFANGVSHLVVSDELEGVMDCVHWLSYVPARKGAPLPVVDPTDPIDRSIEFVPSKSPYDPRHMLAGYFDPTTNHWVSGFFDKDSFRETLAGWAKTVVCGRSRLGGVPLGVIAVETRTMEQITPADPAVTQSHEDVRQQAGQVWFPDSAYKTAQAIKDFNKGEELPLMIFANWRGFSGGLRDLFDEILKFGSYIVDNLREYSQPVFIYIPPFGELRGGAWVVVDPTINPDMMEMYTDDNARGGVLEPNGTIEIKYKDKDILKTMYRLDAKLQELSQQLKQAQQQLLVDESVVASIKSQMKARETELMSVYERIAITFADLHDTPGRMKAKGVIRDSVPWKNARLFFYHRLLRRLKEESLKKQIAQLAPQLKGSNQQLVQTIEQWFHQQQRSSSSNNNNNNQWDDDQLVVRWFDQNQDFIQSKLRELRAQQVQQQIQQLAQQDKETTFTTVLDVLFKQLTPQQKEAALKALQQ